MPNVKSKIDAHNKRTVAPTNADIDRTCNCTRNTICPLDNNCLTKSIVYEATISLDLQNYKPRKYIGLCEGTFKKRFSGHKSSFNLERYQHSTALSTEALRRTTEFQILPGELSAKKNIHTRNETVYVMFSGKI